MRKLAIGAAAFSAAIAISCYLNISYKDCIIPCAACFLFAFLTFAVLKNRLLWVSIAVLGLGFGLLNYSVRYYFTKEAADKMSGNTQVVSVRIISEPKNYESYSTAYVKTVDGDHPKLRAILYDYSGSLTGFDIGDTIYVTARFAPADIRYGQEYDYYNSRDIFYKLTAKSAPSLISKAGVFTELPARLNLFLGNRIDTVFDSTAAPFMKSLLLGDRSDLNKDIGSSIHLSRAGFSHVVAVSGMHIAFLIGLIRLVFGKGKISAAICIVLIWLFALLTGASPSAVRAAIMQTILLSAFILIRYNDPLTSLTVALALILFKNPFASKSVSLQLSFGAMAGLVLFGEKLFGFFFGLFPEGMRGRISKYIAGTAASSIAVLEFTLPLSAVHFGYVSILSPLTNIAALWSVSFCFILGWVCCAFSPVPFLSKPLSLICSLLVRFIYKVTETVSDIPFSVLYMQTKGARLWLAFAVIVIGLVCTFRIRRKSTILILTGMLTVMLGAVLLYARIDYRYGSASFTAVDVGQGQALAVMNEDTTVVIDSGNIFSGDNAGELMGQYLLSRGRTDVDVLIISHYHSDHISGLPALMELVPVKSVLLPDIECTDYTYLPDILSRAKELGAEIITVDRDTSILTDGLSIQIFCPPDTEKENDKCLTALIRLRDVGIFVSGDSTGEAELSVMREHGINDADILVVGHHGSKYSSYPDFIEGIGADTGIISTGYNTYGHPTKETLDRLSSAGYNVLRTDQLGTIELRIR